MKAKLAFIECENEALQEELRRLENALAGKRDELASLKSTRDRLWQQQRQLKEGSVFVTNPMLLQDMQVCNRACLLAYVPCHCHPLHCCLQLCDQLSMLSSACADVGHIHCVVQAQKEKRDDLMAEIELLKQQHAAIVSSSLSVSASGSRGSSPLHTAAASPGRLKSPLKNSSSKAGSVKLLVASAHR